MWSRAQSSSRLFWTGVPVSRNLCRARARFASPQSCPAEFLSRWASSNTTTAQCRAESPASLSRANVSYVVTTTCGVTGSPFLAGRISHAAMARLSGFPW
eukprot:gene3706-biopygen3643